MHHARGNFVYWRRREGKEEKLTPRRTNGKHLLEMQTLRRDGVIEANVARIAFQMDPAIIMRYTIVAL